MLITIESVAAALHKVVDHCTMGDFSPALGLMDKISRPDRLADLLGQVVAHPCEPERCASASFIHTLGFEKFALVNRKPDFMLRLHIWHPAEHRSLGHVHNHRSAIVSTVIRGELGKQIFVRDPAQMPFAEYREELTDGGWRLCAVGTAGLRQTKLTRLGPGIRYALAADTLHRIEAAENELTATLFLETRATRATTNVFTMLDETIREHVPKLPMTVAAYRQHLAATIATLGL
jgi:hypothetical protein